MIELLTLVKRSEQRILTLHPALQVRAFELIKRAYKAGYPLSVCQALRTIEEQEKLYAQGRTAPGNIVTWVRRSYHNFGLAFDIVILTEDGTDCIWDDDDGYASIGQIGKDLGLEWGGDWQTSQRDTPHFQLTFGLSINDLCNGETPPDNIEIPTYEEEEEVENCTIVVNGQTLEGFIKDGRSYAPVGQLGNAIKASVNWDAGSKTATLNAKVVEPVTILVNGQAAGLDGLLTGGHSYAAVKSLANALGASDVKWDETTKTVNIIK